MRVVICGANGTMGKLLQQRLVSEEARAACVIGVDEIFARLRRVRLPAFYERLASCGLEIYLKKLGGLSIPLGERVVMTGDGGLFALGEVREFADGLAIKPIRQFGRPALT